MTDTVLVAGTASHVGKSVVTAGLCRLLSRRGVSVAPFKAQNMSNNARVAVVPGDAVSSARDGEAGPDASEWGEIGVSQYVQARAARVAPTTDMNPVLLKPRGDGESQLVINGVAGEHLEAGAYYDEHWQAARTAAEAAYRRLGGDYDVIVAEGAGSIAEINLQDRDLANVETARFADADIVLVGDIERGGVFASLWGTLELVPPDVRERIAGIVINKFRGQRSVLEPGIEEFEARSGVPILGVLPYDDPGLPAEDSVSLPGVDRRTVLGDDGVPDSDAVTVAVPRLPRISNFTDLEPLARVPGVRVAYLPLSADLSGADAVVLPGSKNTVDDLIALREAGFEDHLQAFDGPIVGICGGFQMLGEHIHNAGVESTSASGSVPGLGLLPIETEFSTVKDVTRTTCSVRGVGPIDGADGTATGYEIHMGQSSLLDSAGGHGERDEPADAGSEPREAGETAPVDVAERTDAATVRADTVRRPLDRQSVARGRVLGTYLHGLFENESVREAFVDAVFEDAGKRRPTGTGATDDPFEAAADLLESHVALSDVDALADHLG